MPNHPPCKLQEPPPALTRTEGHDTYVKVKGRGLVPLNHWKLTNWLSTLDAATLKAVAVRTAKPLPLWLALSDYDCQDTPTGHREYITCNFHKAHEAGITVETVESGDW